MKKFFISVLCAAALFGAMAFGYAQGQYNLYARQCVQNGGGFSNQDTACAFSGDYNPEIMRNMNMMCENPARAYNVEGFHRWKHYCQ